MTLVPGANQHRLSVEQFIRLISFFTFDVQLQIRRRLGKGRFKEATVFTIIEKGI